MRQHYSFVPSKLDDLNDQLIFFFKSIYFQSRTTDTAWSENFIHYKFRPLYKKCTKLKSLLKNVHADFVRSSSADKTKIYFAALNSSNIKAICDITINGLNKEDIGEDIGESIHLLYKYLYYQLPKTKVFKGVYGEFIDHYNNLKSATKIKTCPFCGLEPIKPLNSKTKQTYDHYLPLSKYPLHGICTKNLVPTCETCNKDYKEEKDSHYMNPSRTIRRNLFYPYGNYSYSINIDLKNIVLDGTSFKVKFCRVVTCVNPPSFFKQVDTWQDIYEINTRYKLIIENDSDEWYGEFFDFMTLLKGEGTFIDTPSSYIYYLSSLSVQGSTNNSFLKKAFFENIRPLTNVFD